MKMDFASILDSIDRCNMLVWRIRRVYVKGVWLGNNPKRDTINWKCSFLSEFRGS